MRFLGWTFVGIAATLLAAGAARAGEEYFAPWQQVLAPGHQGETTNPASTLAAAQPDRPANESVFAPLRPIARSHLGATPSVPMAPPNPVPEEIAEFDVEPARPAPAADAATPSPPERTATPPPPGRLPDEPSVNPLGSEWGWAEVGDGPFYYPSCSGCAACGPAGCSGERPQRFFDHPSLHHHGIEVGGWLNLGISAAASNPADRFKGPVTFNDRHAEAQMNQLWLFAAREADSGGYGFDWGGRVDLLYGTDARFARAAGLEERWGEPERFYQLALPQFYFDVALNRWTFRFGHFFTILGYERVEAPANFFYSHAYAHQYAEPFTHTGMLATWDLSDQWSLSAGMHRGADQFEDLDGLDALNFLGGLSWTSRNERLGVAFGLNADEFGPRTNRTQYSLVTTLRLTDRLQYVFQHDYVQETDRNENAPRRFAEAYGINQYLFYEFNPCWSGGLRVEWFRDQNGHFVVADDPGNVASQGGFAGSFSALTLGVNWEPSANVALRPEVRWDWFAASNEAVPRPFDAGNRNNQFSYGFDLIVQF